MVSRERCAVAAGYHRVHCGGQPQRHSGSSIGQWGVIEMMIIKVEWIVWTVNAKWRLWW
jgi:hypothetical protein